MPTKWIPENNLEPVCRILAGYARYDFSELDWDAIKYGVQDTFAEKDKWFEYPFLGEHKIHLRFAYDDPGSSVIFIEWSAPPNLHANIETLLHLAAGWTITR